MTVYRVVSLKRWRAVAAGLVAVALLAGAWAGLRGAAAVPAEAANGTVCLPILMYHGVLEDPGRQGLYVVSPALLESDLQWLRDNGYLCVKTVPKPQKP